MSMTSPSRSWHAGRAFAQVQRGHVAGGRRRGGVHGRVDLDAGGDADDGHPVADGVADVARGAVATGEEDEVRPRGAQVARGLLGVVGRS